MEREAEILLVYPREFQLEHLQNCSTFIKEGNKKLMQTNITGLMLTDREENRNYISDGFFSKKIIMKS